MLDVLHYMFEEDYSPETAEAFEAKNNVRKTIYKNYYNREYRYAVDSSSTGSKSNFQADGEQLSFSDDLDSIEPLDPIKMSQSVKPYTPPTDFNPDSPLPFGRTLDAPLN